MIKLPFFSLSRPAAKATATNHLFAALSRRELRIISGFMHERQYLQGEIIFDEGDEGQAIYFVRDGLVSIRHQEPPMRVIATLGVGDFFGEMALLAGERRTAQACAASDCDLQVLFRGDFDRLMEAHARIASKVTMALARHLGERLRRTLEAASLSGAPM